MNEQKISGWIDIQYPGQIDDAISANHIPEFVAGIALMPNLLFDVLRNKSHFEMERTLSHTHTHCTQHNRKCNESSVDLPSIE